MNCEDQLTQVRRLIGCRIIYQEGFVQAQCERLYGKPLSKSTWFRWRQKVRASADPEALKGMSEATYVLLLTLAKLHAASSHHRRRQVPIARLVESARQIIKGNEPIELLEANSYQQLRDLIELQAARSYSERYHRLNGLKKTQPWYSKAEAIKILSNYPNYSHDQQQAS